LIIQPACKELQVVIAQRVGKILQKQIAFSTCHNGSPMKILNEEKLKETLFENWTRYIDYTELGSIIINTIKLYASNWNTIALSKNFTTKKITISKIDFHNGNLLWWFNFEMPFNEKTAIGTIELIGALGKQPSFSQITGNFYLNNA
jgi:hypothetical protein